MKKNSHRRTNTAQFHFFEISKVVKLNEAYNRMVVARDWGKGKWGIAVKWV